MNGRYGRQQPLIGAEGQERLQRARVLIVGVGGLGSPVALYLTAAGVGTLGLIDDDVVSESNLQRQILYREHDLGVSKVRVATDRLKAMNSAIVIEPYECRLTAGNAREIIARYDIVVDGCDNFATRQLIGETCSLLGVPYVYGAIQGFEGQVSVFDARHSSVSYGDLFTLSEHADENRDLSVIGATAAVVGGVEASEVMKLVCGCGEPLYGRLWTIDLQTMTSCTLKL